MSPRTWTLLLLLALPGSTTLAQEPNPRAERWAKLIAPFLDEMTCGVVHVDLESFQVNEALQHLKKIGLPIEDKDLQSAVPLITALQKQFVTGGAKDLFVLMHWTAAQPFTDVLVVAPFTDADQAKVAEAALKLTQLVQVRIKDNVLLAGTKGAFAWADTLKPKAVPQLLSAFQAVADQQVQAILLPPEVLRRAMRETMPRLPKEVGAGPTTLLTQGITWGALGQKLGAELETRLVIQCADTQAAKDLGAALDQGYAAFANLEDVKNLIPNVAKLRSQLLPRVQGDRLVTQLEPRGWQDFFAPLAGQARERVLEQHSMNNLKQLGLAMHNYHDVNRSFPGAASIDKAGKPLLSWRVQVLPYLEHNELYQQFKLDEPWDSDHNKKLITKMPAQFKSPLSPDVPPGKTTYLAPVGPKTMFGGKMGMAINKITDGTANTIMLVEAEAGKAVIWTQPDDLSIAPKEPWAGLLRGQARGFLALFADGSVRMIPRTMTPADLYGLFTMDGGEVVPR